MNLQDMRANAYLKAQKPLDSSQKNKSQTSDSNGLLKVTKTENEKDSVYRRVAKFFLIIGEENAAKILPLLNDNQIDKIIFEIASIRTISDEEKLVILEEFNSIKDDLQNQGGIYKAREILEKAYGKERAQTLLNKAIPVSDSKPFSYLENADSERILNLLKDENPGIQSLVLSHLPPKKSASIINKMNDEEKKEVVLRLAKMEKMSPEIVHRVDLGMKEKFSSQVVEKSEIIDGRNALAEILKNMNPSTENEILKTLEEGDFDLSQDLRKRLFTQDDVIKSDDLFIQKKLQKMTDEEICKIIAGKKEEFRNKILSNVSSGRKNQILSEEEILMPLKKSDCDFATQNFISYLRKEFENGNLRVKNRNDEEEWV